MDNKPMFKAGDKVKFGRWSNPSGLPMNHDNWVWIEDTGVYQYQHPRTKLHCILSNDGLGYHYPREVELLDPYATYDGGKSQYDADLATLDAAAEYGANSETPDGKFSYEIAVVLSRMLPYLRGKGVL